MSDWPSVKLADCTEIVSGATPRTSEATYWGGEIWWAWLVESLLTLSPLVPWAWPLNSPALS